MNNEWEMVKKFHKVANHPCPETPNMIPPDRLKLRAIWMKEEIEELCEADELCDKVDAVIDLIYFALGTLVEMGVPPDPFFEIIHSSNMEKIPKTNSPIYNKDSKVMKPADWKHPTDLLKKELLKLYK